MFVAFLMFLVAIFSFCGVLMISLAFCQEGGIDWPRLVVGLLWLVPSIWLLPTHPNRVLLLGASMAVGIVAAAIALALLDRRIAR